MAQDVIAERYSEEVYPKKTLKDVIHAWNELKKRRRET